MPKRKPNGLTEDQLNDYEIWRKYILKTRSTWYTVETLGWIISSPNRDSLYFLVPHEATQTFEKMKILYETFGPLSDLQEAKDELGK